MLRDSGRIGPVVRKVRVRVPSTPGQHELPMPASFLTVDEVFELTRAAWTGGGLVHQLGTVLSGARTLGMP